MSNSNIDTASIKKPIIILGAARSGTHLLSQCLEHHPDVAYISEPNFVWRAYNADIGHDMLPVSRASDDVKKYITSRFDSMRIDLGGTRICDKTPSNTMRLPFVLEVFPDAKLIHVVRDGRDVAVSALRKYKGNVQKVTTGSAQNLGKTSKGSLGNLGLVAHRAKHRLRQGVRFADMPYYVPKVLDATAGLIGLKKQFAWGPEFPGMRSMMKTHPLIEVCALQWQISVESVLNVLSARPSLPCIEIKFERLVRDYDNVAREIYDFVELPDPGRVYDFETRGFDPDSSPFESDLSTEEQKIVLDRISGTLSRLGYV